jgi:hypothetical protein
MLCTTSESPALRGSRAAGRIGRVFINGRARDRSDLRRKCAAIGAPSLGVTTAAPSRPPRPSRIVAIARRSEPSSERSFMHNEHSYHRPMIGRKGTRVGLPVPGSLNREVSGCRGRRNASARATSCSRRVRADPMPLQRLLGKEPNGLVRSPHRSTKRRSRCSTFVFRSNSAWAARPEASPTRAPLLCTASAW